MRYTVSIHPCDIMWQVTLFLFHGLLLPLTTSSILPWTISSSFGLAESSGYEVMNGKGRKGTKQGFEIPIPTSSCILLLPSSSSSPFPGAPLCNLYDFLLPVLQGQQKPAVRCRVKHPTEQIAIAKCTLITLTSRAARGTKREISSAVAPRFPGPGEDLTDGFEYPSTNNK